MPGIKVAAASNGLNPDLYTGVCCHYALYSHVYRFAATSKLDLCRWPSLADGYLSPLRESRSLRAPCKRSVLKRFNVNTRSNLSRALCRPREKGTHALVPYRSPDREGECERSIRVYGMREIVREERKKKESKRRTRKQYATRFLTLPIFYGWK
jgi:hypothetical protein